MIQGGLCELVWKRGLTLWTSGDHDHDHDDNSMVENELEVPKTKTSQIANTCKSEGLFDGLKKEITILHLYGAAGIFLYCRALSCPLYPVCTIELGV